MWKLVDVMFVSVANYSQLGVQPHHLGPGEKVAFMCVSTVIQLKQDLLVHEL